MCPYCDQPNWDCKDRLCLSCYQLIQYLKTERGKAQFKKEDTS